MALSEDILALFAKTTKDEPEETVNTTVYGTTVEYNGKIYVKIDGSDALTPISKTTDVVKDERVTVDIKNHTATVTGNVSSPAARTDDVKELGKQISEFEIVIADKVSTKELEAERGRIDDLVSDNATIKNTLKATNADIGSLKAYDVTVGRKLTAVEAEIEDLEAKKVSAEFVEATYATIENLKATNTEVHNLNSTYGEFVVLTTNNFKAVDASIENLETSKLSAEQANLKYANIDFSNIGKAAMEYFYSQSGLIENVKIGDATITGNLIGVTIKGDLLEGGTVKADKLVVKGTDGLYYKLNTDGVKIEAEQTDYNSINGSVITAKSITASKIDVKDLVAFNATIGGLKLTEGAIYSGVKESVDNSTKGFYLDKDGQMNVGDSTSYIKYYDDADGNRKLEIAADAITFGSTKKSIDKAIDDAVDSVEVGGRNLQLGTQYWTDLIRTGSGVSISDEVISCPQSIYIDCNFIEVNPGDEITVSVDAKCDVEKSQNGVLLWQWYSKAVFDELSANRVSYEYVSADVTTGWKRIISTVTVPSISDIKYLLMGLRARDAGIVYFKHLKVEKGNKATDWSPAPEDVQKEIDDLTVGGRNLIIRSTETASTGVATSGEVVAWTNHDTSDYIPILPNTEYIFTKNDSELAPQGYFRYALYDSEQNYISRAAHGHNEYAWKSPETAYYIRISYPTDCRVKFEKGNKATDWSPAPEDVQQEIDDVGSTASDASERVGEAETLIQQLSDTISMLITDGTGASLMTQTEDGWTFSMGNINDALDNVSNGLDDLTKSVSDTDEVVSVLEAAVNDLGVLSNYVKITTDGDQPCIELGTGNSDFKLLITNTDIRFMEGSDIPAYINNQSLNITKAVVEEELIQGDFIWKIRSNGNMGLMWKGASS